MLIWLGFGLAWLVGGLLGAELLAKVWRGESLRSSGSGNPGASNALRVRGKLFALLVLLWDVLKAVAVLSLLPPLLLPYADMLLPDLSALLGLAVVAGHLWPPLYGFKGGKGVATALGVLLVVLPAVVPAVLLLWLLLFFATGYAGLASAIASVLLPVWAISTGDADSGKALMAFCMMLTALILGAHRENLQKLLRGQENRFDLPWLKASSNKSSNKSAPKV